MIRVFHSLSFTALLLASLSGFAQQSNTRGSGTTTDSSMIKLLHGKMDTTMPHKILLIPFEPKMFMSEIGKDVNAKTNLSYKAITDEFRKELDLAMYNALRMSCVTVTLLDGKHSSDTTMGYIYSSTTYGYEPVPGTAIDAGGSTEYDPKHQKDHYIDKGQLSVPVDYTKRFMNTTVQNPHLLSQLSGIYNTDTYVFINELDIKNVDNATENLSEDTYRRQVTVHYSIIDNTGHYVSKGVAITYFPYRENDPKEIGDKYFTVIARTILKNYIQGLNNDKMQADKKKKPGK